MSTGKDLTDLPSQDSKALRYFIRRVSMIVGVELSDGNKYHPRFITVLLFSLIAECMHITGLIDTFPDFKSSCLSLTVYSMIFQQVARLFNRNVLNDEKKILKLEYLVNKFMEDAEKDVRNIPKLKAGIKQTKMIIQVYLTLSFIVYNIPVFLSCLLAYVTDERVLFGHIRLPFTSLENSIGFMINSLLTLLLSFMVYYLYMLSDMVFIFHSNLSVTMTDVIVQKLKFFSVNLIDRKRSYEFRVGNMRKCKSNEVAVLLKNILDTELELIDIIKLHEDYNYYIQSILDSYQYTAFFALWLNSIALALSLIAVRFVSFSTGCAVSGVLLFQVLLPCVNGNLIANQNNRILHAVYEFPWYELSIRNRKVYLQFYNNCQHTKVLKLPIIGKCDMELFKNFVNASYSYLTFLVNFIKN